MTQNIDLDYLHRWKASHIKNCKECSAWNTDYESGVVCAIGTALLNLEVRKINANIPLEYRSWTLDRVIDKNLNEVMTQVLNFVNNLQNNIDNGNGLFLCSEETGTGKSAIASGIGMKALELGYYVYFDGFDRCKNMLSDKFLNYEIKEKFRQKLLNVDILILDDLGLEETLSDKQRDFVMNYLTLLFKERCNNMKSTIFTSNKKVEDLERLYGNRFWSVFMGRIKTIEFPKYDYRALDINIGGYET